METIKQKKKKGEFRSLPDMNTASSNKLKELDIMTGILAKIQGN